MRFEWTFTGTAHDRLAERILDAWSDRCFYADLSKELRLDDHTVDISSTSDHLAVQQRLTFATRGVPSVFRGLLGVGESMQVTWTTDLSRTGGVSGETAAHTGDDKLKFSAQTSLTASDDAVVWVVDGPLRLKAPWVIRGAAEAQLANLLRAVLEDQAKVTEAWVGW